MPPESALRKNAQMAMWLMKLEPLLVERHTLPNKYRGPEDRSFPRENACILMKNGRPVYWLPGHVNDIYEQDGVPVRLAPHYSDDDGPSREMEEVLATMGLASKYVLALAKLMKHEDEPWSAILMASCEQRLEAATQLMPEQKLPI